MVRRKIQRADLITDAAIKVFADKGYYPSRINDIAQEACVGYGSIYHYFKSKEEILLHIYRESMETIVKRIAKISKNGVSPAEMLFEILELIFRGYRKNPQLMKVLVTEVPQLSHLYNSECQKLYHRFFVQVVEIFKEGQRRGDFRNDISPMIAVFVMDSTIRPYILNLKLCHEHLSIEEAKRQIMKLLTKCI